MNFQPSAYQEAIYKEIADPKGGNLLIEAVAGSGKTSTCLTAIDQLIEGDAFPHKIIFIAFNKNIAIELSKKVPDGVDARTFNSLGHRTLCNAIKGRIKLDKNKNWNIINAMQLGYESELYGYAVGRLVDLAKGEGIGVLIPNTSEQWLELISRHDIEFNETCGHEGTPERAVEIAQSVLATSIQMAGEGVIDFSDQLYLPLLWNLHFKGYDYIFVDECQDVNRVQRAILKKVAGKNGRVIAVGDTKQSIYGFRGADSNAMELLRKEFGMKELPLSICYRCAKNIVHLAKTVVPQIEAVPNAESGDVVELQGYQKSTFKAGDAIICRNNKPLVEMVYQLIGRGVSAKVRGRDIGKGLKALIEKMKAVDLNQLVDRLEMYRQKMVDLHVQKGDEDKAQAVEDVVDTLLVIIDRANVEEFPYDLEKEIDSLFTDNGGNHVLLSSIHKAKGLEWGRVFFLDRDLIPSKWAKQDWQITQEDNLYYVGITRAKEELSFIQSDNWIN